MTKHKETKDYLNQYLTASKKVKIIENTLKEMNEDIGVSGVNYDGLPKSGVITSKTENDAIELAEKVNELRQAKREANALMLEIVGIILSVENAEVSSILFSRYIRGHLWEYIELETFYSESQVMRLHRFGLREVERIRRERDEKEKSLSEGEN